MVPSNGDKRSTQSMAVHKEASLDSHETVIQLLTKKFLGH